MCLSVCLSVCLPACLSVCLCRLLLGLIRPGFQPRVADDLDLSNFDRALTTDVTWKTSDLLRGDSCPAMEDLVPPPRPPAAASPQPGRSHTRRSTPLHTRHGGPVPSRPALPCGRSMHRTAWRHNPRRTVGLSAHDPPCLASPPHPAPAPPPSLPPAPASRGCPRSGRRPRAALRDARQG